MPYQIRARTRKLLHWCCIGAGLTIMASILLWPAPVRAGSPAHLCEVAADNAARRHDVPLDVMRAIALVETGRVVDGQLAPWPWAVHAQGRGHWASSKAAALTLVRDTLTQGYRNIDLGCFQINLHWHGASFLSLEQMIDPTLNADHAARLLRGHKARLGSWERAAGAYHSATPELAARYIARFARLRVKAAPPDLRIAAVPRVAAPGSENRFALLQGGGSGARGSLVPQVLMTGRLRLIDLDAGQP